MTQSEVAPILKRIFDVLPDRAEDALIVLATCYATSAMATGIGEKRALDILKERFLRVQANETELTQ